MGLETTEGQEKAEEDAEMQARDIHIEYENNRYLNTNNRKVLQVSTFLKKIKKKQRQVFERGL